MQQVTSKQEAMRKVILFLLFILINSLSFAQDFPTKFLGIPVDGSKSQMIKKLQTKGFTYNEYNDHLEGEFNGEQVYILVTTNRNKVWRICVVDRYPTSDVSNIRNRYNRLVEQFYNKTSTYFPALSNKEDYLIPETEDLSYEMTVHNKHYEAPFIQKLSSVDELPIFEKAKERSFASTIGKGNFEDLSDEEKKDFYDILARQLAEVQMQRSVWFTINRNYGEYRLVIFYDNENNHANGEDL